ncbi:MAG: redoxin family protein [Candidatus Aegiribacteria sp.]
MRYRKPVDYLWIFLVLVFLYPAIRYGSSPDAVGQSVEQGPLFEGRAALDSLVEQARGRPVIINFWATWCSPCVGELPHIDNVYRSMEGDVEALAVDIGDPRLETLLGFREEFTLSMPVIWLSRGEAAALKRDWELPDVLPVTIILDGEGNETVRAAGARDESFFLSAVSGAAVMPPDTVVDSEPELHLNVVGPPSDSMTILLHETSVELAGPESVDLFDPSSPLDSMAMEELYLPFTGFPYAQPCVGDACGRIARTPEELLLIVESLLN